MNRSVNIIRQERGLCAGCHCGPSCFFRQYLLPELPDSEAHTRSRTLQRGERVFSQQDMAQGLYVVKSGSFKSSFSTPEGVEQITAYHFPGDLLGIDSEVSGHHNVSVTALETASICQLPTAILSASAQSSQVCFSTMMHLMANQISEREMHTFVISNFSTKQRLAWFLIKISKSLRARNLDCSAIHLSMSRQDIANYLAMAIETVSRVFSEFENEGTLEVQRKDIRILEPKALTDCGDIIPSFCDEQRTQPQQLSV